MTGLALARIGAHTLIFLLLATSLAAAEARIQTLQYLETSGPIEGPHYVARVMIQNGSVKRMTLRSAHLAGPILDTTVPAPTDSVEIYDARQGRRVYLHPAKKQFERVLGFKHSFYQGERTDPVRPDLKVDLNAALDWTKRWHRGTELPEQVVDGRLARGYSVRDGYNGYDHFHRTRITTTWIDVATYLPVRIEVEDFLTKNRNDGGLFIQRDIRINEPIDPALFSTDPPAGYTVLPDREF